MQRKPLYGVNKENQRNNTNIQNNMNLTNVVNPTYTKISSRLNSFGYTEHNNTMEESNNVNDIFNKLHLMNDNKKTLNNGNININTLNTYTNTTNIKERNINRSLKIGKTTTSTRIPMKDINNKKEPYKYSSYLNEGNTINANTERNYHLIGLLEKAKY